MTTGRTAIVDQKFTVAVASIDDAFSSDLIEREYVADALLEASRVWRSDVYERKGLYEFRYDVEAAADLLCFLEVDEDFCSLQKAYLGPFDVTDLVQSIKERIEDAAERQLSLERVQSRTDNRIP